MDYKKAGVDIEAGYKSVELMKEHVKKTMRPEVLGGLGGFAGAFDLDYIACGKNYPEKIASIVSGVAEGCLQSECALVGGETAEHPGLMPEDDYDLAGFAVGVVDKKDIIDGRIIDWSKLSTEELKRMKKAYEERENEIRMKIDKELDLEENFESER